MKKLIIEDTTEGLIKLMGRVVTIYCDSWIYSGELIGVNEDCILLDKAKIVYDTGSHKDKNWSLAEDIPSGKWYIMKNKIESFGVLKDAQATV